jgi:hypothetical protein
MHMTEPASPTTPRPRASGPFSWILAAVAFVLGIGAGAATVALLGGDSNRLPATVTTTASPGTNGAAAGTETADVTAQITVNEACVSALNAAQDAYLAIAELGDAARQFDVGRLDEIVRRLQPLQANLQSDIAACNITANAPGGAGSSGGLPPTGSAPASPPTSSTG